MFWVSKDLNLLQKRCPTEIKKMLDKAAEDPTLIKYIITVDGTWVYKYDIKTIKQSSVWRAKNEPKLKIT